MSELIEGTFEDYLNYQIKYGIDKDLHPFYDPEVLFHFYDLTKDRRLYLSSIGSVSYHPHIKLPDVNVWISRSHFMEEYGYELALSSNTCHMCPPKDWPLLLELAQDPSWVSSLGKDFITKIPHVSVETLRFDDPTIYPDQETHARYHSLWVKSPISDCRTTIDEYLMTLKSSHRYKLRKGQRQWSHCTVQKEVITRDQIFDWALPNLFKRHQYFEFQTAAMQLLLGYAAIICGRGDMFTFRAPNGELIGAFYHIHDGHRRIYQGSIKNEHLPNNNIGAALFYHSIDQYCKDPNVDWFDPTCVTSPWLEFNGVDFYKTFAPNVDAWFGCTLLAFNKDLMDKHIEPPYVCSWESPELDHIVIAPDKHPK